MEEKQKSAVEWLYNQLSINNIALDKGTKAHQEMELKILEQAKAMEDSQATNYAKWSMDIHKLTGRFFTFLEWLKDDPKDHEDYEIIKSLNEPKQSVQEYEQQGLDKYSHELAEAKTSEKERMIEFACDVYDLNYGKDKSFRKQAEDFYNKTFKNK
jgi:hypothetical protein